MKASSATSARVTTTAPPTGPSSASPPPSPTRVEEFALTGPSKLPDPAFHAYRDDLADIALAGTVIASHYSEPLPRRTRGKATLFADATESSAQIAALEAGDPFLMLDDSLGWAWGYAGPDRRVGYVPSDSLGD